MKIFLRTLLFAPLFLLFVGAGGNQETPVNKLDPLSWKVLDTMHNVTIHWPIEKLEKRLPFIKNYLAAVTRSVQDHNWPEFIKLCDKDNYAAQQKLGIPDHQYIYEIFNVDSVIAKDYPAMTKNIISSISKMEITSYNYVNNDGFRTFTFFGTFTFGNGKTEEFKFDVIALKKMLWIIGAVG